jgi:endonuclease/exonuclease/phosphatase family metal-dependent hydrolase
MRKHCILHRACLPARLNFGWLSLIRSSGLCYVRFRRVLPPILCLFLVAGRCETRASDQSFPTRLSIVTYNLWKTERWPERAPAVRHFMETIQPDILCVQELTPKTRDFLDSVMTNHTRVHDAFEGWANEGNIYWKQGLFETMSVGAEDVGIGGQRRLFWVRLKVRGSGHTVLVSTAHLTFPLGREECETGLSPRVAETRRIVEALKRLAGDREPVFFMGDLNDPIHPTRLLHEAGYHSCFAALGTPAPPTVVTAPTGTVLDWACDMRLTVDWIVANAFARPLAAMVPQIFKGDFAPSDHWPVLAVYEL